MHSMRATLLMNKGDPNSASTSPGFSLLQLFPTGMSRNQKFYFRPETFSVAEMGTSLLMGTRSPQDQPVLAPRCATPLYYT